MKDDMRIVSLRERPELAAAAAAWFHEKWGVPEDAYLKCITDYVEGKTEYGWFLCLDGEHIVGGLGMIENDFHERRDLAPNVCAVWTEEAYRGRGIAGRLLDRIAADSRAAGIQTLYLVTEHTGFYERYGWEFLCMAREENSDHMTRVYRHG